MQQRCQQRPVGRLEPDLLRAKVALQHSDLMAQREDLGVLVPITAWQQPQQRERVRDTEVRQSKEHRQHRGAVAGNDGRGRGTGTGHDRLPRAVIGP
ncbi:hypothetical protein [Micromonospora sp. NPDC093277]|uniref:hypothetical protein n=1 Tax=Micromonospora sp. NPDC093277 TaxID=3364291 RepID=UPI00381E8350